MNPITALFQIVSQIIGVITDFVQAHPTGSFQTAVVVLLALIAMRLGGRIVSLIKRDQRRNMWRQALQGMRYVPASNTFARRQPNSNRFAELGNMRRAGRTDLGGGYHHTN